LPAPAAANPDRDARNTFCHRLLAFDNHSLVWTVLDP